MIKSCTSLIWFYPNQILTRGDTQFNKHLDWSILTPFSLMHASKINYIDFVMTSDLLSVLEKFNVRHQWKCASSVAGFTACVVYRICNGLYHIVNVPAAWLTTSWAVCEPGAASRLFIAAVMTECTTQTAKKCVCVCLQCLFFLNLFFLLCTILCSLWLSPCSECVFAWILLKNTLVLQNVFYSSVSSVCIWDGVRMGVPTTVFTRLSMFLVLF